MNALQHSMENLSDADSSTQILPFSSEKAKIPSTYNIFKIIASVSVACVCAICQYFSRNSMPTLANSCNCKPCFCKECTDFARNDDGHSVELRLLYENKSDEKLDEVECKYNFSNHRAASIVYESWQNAGCRHKLTGMNPVTTTPLRDSGDPDACQCSTCSYANCIQRCLSVPLNQPRDIISDITRLNGPYENSCNLTYTSRLGIFRRYHDFHTTLVENHPLNINDPIHDEVFFLCGHCECKNKHHYKQYLVDNFKLHKQRCTDSAVCKCSPCECLSCPFEEQASRAGSEESYKTSIIRKYIEDEWKRKSKVDEPGTQNYTKGCRHLGGPTKNVISKVGDVKCSGNCSRYKTGPDAHARPCQCSNSNMKSIKEMLHNVYGPDIEIEENDKKILNEQFSQNNYGSCTVVNHATNTDITMENKSIETSFQQSVENKVKTYEYTLKIEIITPNFDSITKNETKQRVKKVSKNKIKEQTQKVMKDIINDISKKSVTELPKQPSDIVQKNSKDIGSIEQSRKPSILKQTTSPVSIKTIKTSSANRTPSIVSSTRSKGTKMEDFTVGYITPLQQIIIRNNTGNVTKESKLESSSIDGSLLFQNSSNLQSPAQISRITSVIEMELVKYLDELRVQDPCVRRVSYHTVSLKWKSPKSMEDVSGYEILVDGKTIEKILNPKRCMAVISCLPPVRRLLITIRTITKSPSRGLLPCTTIGYRPRANKFIRI